MDGIENQRGSLVITKDFSNHLTNVMFFSTFFVMFAHIRGFFPNYNDNVHWFGTTFSTSVVYPFFMISGLLLGKNFCQEKWYGSVLKKRFWTLLVPLLLWCILFQLLQFGNAWLHGGFQGAEFQAKLHEDPFGLFFTGVPCDVPLWFMRTLIYFVLLSPLFAVIVKSHKYAAEIFAVACVVVHVVFEEMYYRCGCPVFRYLSLGYFDLIGLAAFVWGSSLAVWPNKFAWLARWRDLPPPPKTRYGLIALLVAIHCLVTYPASFVLGAPWFGFIRIAVVLEGVLFYFGCTWAFSKGAPTLFTSAIFFVYAAHSIFIGILKGILASRIPTCIPQEITYFLVYALVVILSFASYFLCLRLFPRLTTLLTGSRAAGQKTDKKA